MKKIKLIIISTGLFPFFGFFCWCILSLCGIVQILTLIVALFTWDKRFVNLGAFLLILPFYIWKEIAFNMGKPVNEKEISQLLGFGEDGI